MAAVCAIFVYENDGSLKNVVYCSSAIDRRQFGDARYPGFVGPNMKLYKLGTAAEWYLMRSHLELLFRLARR